MKLPERNNRIANMAFVCALLVVTVHVGSLREGIDSGWWFRQVFTKGLAACAVSFFFLVSGYFLSLHCDEPAWWLTALRKRVRTVLVPYFCCIALSLCITFPISCIADIIADRPFGTTPFPFLRGYALELLGLNFGPPYYIHLWYLRLLIVLVVISPILVWIIRHAVGLLILLIPLSCYYNTGYELVFNYGSVFYFTIGMMIGIKKITIDLARYRVLLVLATIVVLTLKIILLHQGYAWPSLAGFAWIVLLMMAVWSVMPSTPWPSALIGSSFPIYLYHWAFLSYPSVLLTRVWGDAYGAGPSIIKCIVSILLSILFSVVCKKYAPRLAKNCFGGRV